MEARSWTLLLANWALSNSGSQIGLVEWKSTCWIHISFVSCRHGHFVHELLVSARDKRGERLTDIHRMYHSSNWLLGSSSNEISLWNHMRHTLPIQSIHIYPFPRFLCHKFSNHVPSKFPIIQPIRHCPLINMIHTPSYLSFQTKWAISALFQVLPIIIFPFITFRTTQRVEIVLYLSSFCTIEYRSTVSQTQIVFFCHSTGHRGLTIMPWMKVEREEAM